MSDTRYKMQFKINLDTILIQNKFKRLNSFYPIFYWSLAPINVVNMFINISLATIWFSY